MALVLPATGGHKPCNILPAAHNYKFELAQVIIGRSLESSSKNLAQKFVAHLSSREITDGAPLLQNFVEFHCVCTSLV